MVHILENKLHGQPKLEKTHKRRAFGREKF